jgi:hypothetical protein
MMKSDTNKIAMQAASLFSYPSSRVAVGREGRSEAEARVGGLERPMSKKMCEEPPSRLTFVRRPFPLLAALAGEG